MKTRTISVQFSVPDRADSGETLVEVVYEREKNLTGRLSPEQIRELVEIEKATRT